jgi:diguanylate cyclase (GGDEF)-like protein
VARSIQTVEPTLRRFSLVARNGQRLEVDANVIPVTGSRGNMHGALVLLRDASTQITLEQRLRTLHEKATRDALTQVANRAEFDRALESAVHLHLPKGLPCSLIVCDLDHFKRINDNFGHQAGDTVLVAFAQLLKANCRPGDLVARYGGEEFILLCPDCDNATATKRAEVIRTELESTPQPALGGQYITASFGVTELQQGDTPETFFRRADRALYQAKNHGRNVVVQLGTGIVGDERPVRSGWFSWFRSPPPDQLLKGTLVTAVPLNLASEKLRGFVSDHHAAIDVLGENRMAIRIDGDNVPLARRSSDRAVPFVIELTLEESRGAPESRGAARTVISVTIRPQRSRDRRRRDLLERARQLIASLKAYLVAQELNISESPAQEGIFDRARKAASPWWF